MKYRIAAILLATTVLSACGSSNNSPSPPPLPPVVVAPTPQENAFGANFAAAFRASDTAAPITPADSDIIPLSLTTEPVKIG